MFKAAMWSGRMNLYVYVMRRTHVTYRVVMVVVQYVRRCGMKPSGERFRSRTVKPYRMRCCRQQ